MTVARRLARRTAWMVATTYLVVTAVFLLVVLAEGPARQPTLPALDVLLDRYADWLVRVATFDWGVSTSRRAPVTAVVLDAVPHTLAYVLPAMAVATVGGVGVGLYAALNRHGRVDRLGSTVAYVGFGVPDFVVGSLLLLLFALDRTNSVAYDDGLVQRVLFPGAVLATSLLASQLRYTRAEALEYVGSDVLKLVRAKGAPGWRVAWHALRNAAVPLLSLFFVDALTVLAVNVYVVESVFAIPGLGFVSFTAFRQQDLPLVVGTTLVLVSVGVVGSFLQDVAYEALDPRVGED